MNKRISTKIAIVIILIVSVVAGGEIYFGDFVNNKQIESNYQSSPAMGDEKQQESLEKIDSNQETVLIWKNGPTHFFDVNLVTKELKSRDNPVIEVEKLAGLPQQVKTKMRSDLNNIEIVSEDGKKVIVVSRILNKEGLIVGGKEFICDVVERKCASSEILDSAYKSSGRSGQWHDYLHYSNYLKNDKKIFWDRWDSEKNILYGNFGSNGFHDFPVYIFYANTGTMDKVADHNKSMDYESIPNNNFSPSLSKFVIISDNKKKLSLFNIDNLPEPFKKFDISSINDSKDQYDQFYPIEAVAWSGDEKKLILETHKQIFVLNLDDGKIDLKYTSKGNKYGSFLETNMIHLSKDERYIVFVDHENGDMADSLKRMDYVLKSIDLKNNDEVMELLRLNYPLILWKK